MKRSCEIAGCDRPHKAVGFCDMHYRRLQRTGSTLKPQARAISTEQRFFRWVAQEGDCWQWTGSLSARGYARIRDAGVLVYAHRWSYEHFRAEIPYGLQIDHLCRNRGCVNPWHLEPVTSQVNMDRSSTPRLVVGGLCQNGHQIVSEKDILRNGRWKRCAECNRRSSRRAALRAHLKRIHCAWREAQVPICPACQDTDHRACAGALCHCATPEHEEQRREVAP